MLQFNQPSSKSAVLNRVTGSSPSRIDGTCLANGSVYLVNPQGIVVGPEGKIRTAGFTGSSLEIAEQAFLSNEALHFQGNSEKSVVNRGIIEAFDGDVLLLAREVENEGAIFANRGSVLLTGASEERLDKGRVYILPEGGGMVFNAGTIEALRTEIRASGGNVLSLAINHPGIIEAPEVLLQSEKAILQATGQILSKNQEAGGSVNLLSEDINLLDECLIDASGKNSGGKIVIGGDAFGPEPDLPLARSVYVGEKVRLKADVLERGSGGRIIVWGDESNYFYADVSARGGEISGDGGFVEISSHLGLDYQGNTDTLAPKGRTGTLLLDPVDITISAAGSSPIPIPPPTSTYYYCPPPGASATLSNTNLQNALATANIIVSTACGSGALGTTGNITWNAGAPLTWSAVTTLSLIADRAMSLGSDITNSGAGSFTAMNFQAGGTGTGTFIGISVAAGVTITSQQGAIVMDGRGGDTAASNAGVQINAGATVSSTGTGANAATISITGTTGGTTNFNVGVLVAGAGAQVSSVDGNIDITGTNTATGAGFLNHGIQISAGGRVLSTGTSSASAARLTINGTGSTSATGLANFGVYVTGTNSLVSSVAGAINIQGATNTGNAFIHGIRIDTAGVVSSTGTGSNAAPITITGTASATGGSNLGLGMTSLSTRVSTADGSITMTGSCTTGTTVCHGISITNGSGINYSGNTAGTIQLTGTGGGTSGDGVEIATASIGIVPPAATSSSKDIFLTGTGAGTGIGLDINNPIGTSGTGTATGDITLESDNMTIGASGTIETTGDILIQPLTPGASIGLAGAAGTLNLTTAELNQIQARASSLTFGRSNGTGTLSTNAHTFTSPVVLRNSDLAVNTGPVTTMSGEAITLIADTMAIAAMVTGTGALTVQPLTASVNMGLGNGASGTLNLTDAELTNFGLTFSSQTFGHTMSTGTVDMRTFTYADPIVVYGGTISVNGAINAGTNTATFNIGPASAGTLNLNALVTASTFTVNGGAFNDIFNVSVAGQTAVFNGMGGTNTLNGPVAVNAWTITANDAGTLGPISFSNMQNLVGNASTDNFTFTAAAQITGSINGGGGANTLTSPALATDWTVTGANSGTIFPTGASGASIFSNIENLTGNTAADTFAFETGGSLAGALNGGLGGGNTLSYNSYSAMVAVTITTNTANGTATGVTGGFTNIQSFTGSSTSTSTFNGLAAGNTWIILGNDAGLLNSVLTFSQFSVLIGGAAGPDTFTFSGAFRISGLIDGISGTNTLNGPNVSTFWTISGTDAGEILPSGASSTHFAHIQNLMGGDANDAFDFNNGFPIIGTLDGRGGINGIFGPDQANTWMITATDQGTMSALSISFTNIGSLTGGTESDEFIFSEGVGLTGATAGGGLAAANTLNYSLFTTPAIIYLRTPTSGLASNLGAGFFTTGNIIGNAIVNPIPGPSPIHLARLPAAQAFFSTLSAVSLAQISRYNLPAEWILPNYSSYQSLLNWIFYPEIDLKPRWTGSPAPLDERQRRRL